VPVALASGSPECPPLLILKNGHLCFSGFIYFAVIELRRINNAKGSCMVTLLFVAHFYAIASSGVLVASAALGTGAPRGDSRTEWNVAQPCSDLGFDRQVWDV